MGKKLTAALLLSSVFLTFQNCGDFQPQQAYTENRESFSVDPDLDPTISETYNWARTIMQRVAGVSLGPEDPEMIEMMGHLQNQDAHSAIAVATRHDGYYNVTLREIAAPMSNREGNIAEPLNDFIATFVGLVRDDQNAKLMLVGDAYYKGSAADTNKQNVLNDMIRTNDHYQDLDNKGINLQQSLVSEPIQQIITDDNQVIDMPDAAGLITSRAFMQANAFKGSNRRLVEHSLKDFLCSPITSWADINNPDDKVGQDVDRFPVGKNSIFQSTCKACHSAMDAYRPAFAHVDFDLDESNDQFSFIKYKFNIQTDPHPTNPGETVIVPFSQQFIPSKFRRNKDVYPPGFLVTNDTWFNYNLGQNNIERFGWRSPAQGNGIKSFGELLSESKAFSRCMAKKVYKKVCRKDLDMVESPVIQELAEDFEQKNYSVRELTISTAMRSDCFGLDVSEIEYEEVNQ